MNILSLFDGISCGQLALECAGIPVEIYYASEIDKYAIEITQKHFPNTVQLGDVTKIDFTKFSGKIDLLIGGSPCQNLSISGDRTGLEGEQSKLFFEYVRAKNEIKPKWFLLENNASMSVANRNKITQYMDVEPVLIDSAYFSPQSRRRLYWTNIPIDMNFTDKKLTVEDIIDFSHSAENLFNEVRFNKNIEKYDIKPIRIGTIGKGGQGERIYSIKAKSISLTANGGGRGNKTGLYKIDNTVRKLTPLEAERLQLLPDGYTAGVSNTQRYKCIGNGWTVSVIAHIFKGLESEV